MWVAMKTRSQIIDGLRRLRRDVQLDINSIESWNENVRKPDEEPIDPDPFGDLRRLIACIDNVLENDPGHGPIAPLNFQRSH